MFFTVRELAARSGMSQKTIRRWIRDGHVQVERVGPYRRIRIDGDVARQFFGGLLRD